MKRSHLARALLAGAIALSAALPTAASAQTQSLGSLIPERGNVPFLASLGTGVQIYQCNGTAWTFVAPRATLTDVLGRPIISHFGGPTWQDDKDGSKVVGKGVASVTVNPKAIPWLLLSGTPSGTGVLAKTTFIQRLLTNGGLAPAASTCTTANAGRQAEVPYTAEYVFWKKAY